jgi:GT2 family glycosyltransferase
LISSIAIVIPCRNEEKYISRCIQSVLRSDYPKDKVTIYVCDGLSDDKTRSIVKNIASKESNVHLLDNHKRMTPFALNIGLKASEADVKVILGAHSEVYPDFLKENINTLKENPNADCVGGIIENVYEDKRSEIIGKAMSSPFGVGNAYFRTGSREGFVDTVAFGAYRSEVFDKIGYFDEDLTRNQDDEFNYRLIKNKGKIYLSSKIKTKYYVRGSFKKLIIQYKQYGYWKVYVNKKLKTITTYRQLMPSSLYVILLSSIYFLIEHFFVGIIPIEMLVFSITLLLIYLTLGLVFAFKKAGLSKDAFLVFYTFILLHLSYGFGYLVGMIDFLVLNKTPRTSSENLTR